MQDGTHQIIAGGKLGPKEKAKLRRAEEQDIALVNLKRQVEVKKAEKLKKNLHLLDFEKTNQRTLFVSSFDEIKAASEEKGSKFGRV